MDFQEYSPEELLEAFVKAWKNEKQALKNRGQDQEEKIQDLESLVDPYDNEGAAICNTYNNNEAA